MERLEQRQYLAVHYTPLLSELISGLPGQTYTHPKDAYYVSPTVTSDTMSKDPSKPGNLAYTLANAPHDSTVILYGNAGPYRLQNTIVVNRRLNIWAASGQKAVIKGSQIVSNWTKTTFNGKDAWYTPWDHKFIHSNADRVRDPNFPEAVHLDMVFRDGASMSQTLDNPVTSTNEGHASRPFGPGYFYLGQATIGGTTRQWLIIGDNPTEKTMEVTRVKNIKGEGNLIEFTATSSSNNPAGSYVRGLVFAHAANNGVTVSAPNITFERNLFAWNGNFGLGPQAGRLTIQDNHFMGNGHNGVSGNFANTKKLEDATRIQNNLFAYNNNERFKRDWNAAGLKMVQADWAEIYNNTFRNNYCNGLWLDTHANKSQILGNKSYDNLGFGIFFEACNDSLIAFNVVYRNQWSGICVADASNAKIWNNTIVGNRECIEIKDGDRVVHPNKQNFDIDALGEGSWQINYGIRIRNNILSGGTNAQIKASEFETNAQDPDPHKSDIIPEGTWKDGIFNPKAFTHNGSRTMFYNADGETGTFSSVANTINYNAFHLTPTGTNKSAIMWKRTNSDSTQFWSPQDLKNWGASINTAFCDTFWSLGSSAIVFNNAAADDYRLKSGSVLINAGQSLPQSLREAMTKAGISVSNPDKPNIGALPTA